MIYSKHLFNMTRIAWSIMFLMLSCMSVFAQAPANDDPCDAFILPVGTTCSFSQFTNAAATGTTGVTAPGCAGYSGGDVWFSVTVPPSGIIIVDSDEGSMIDGGMAFYTGTCNALTLLDCDNNSSLNGSMPYINSSGLTPGSILYIRFWEKGNNNNGTFSICAYSPSPPNNDNPCIAIPLTVGTGCSFSQYSNTSATSSTGVPAPGCASYSGGDVWFSAVVPASGQLIVNTNSGDITDGGMAIYSGTCGALTLIECDDDDSNNGLMPFISRSDLTPGSTVFIRFWEYGNDNNGTFSICAYSPVGCSSTNSNNSCSTADPFCSTNNYSYCNTVGTASLGSGGIYGCLSSTPNPAFFYLNVANSGDISMFISQQTNTGAGIDVDFVAWGPFTSQSDVCAGISASNIIDCSYSIDAVESFTITNAQAGEWYMVLITNYSNSAGTINFSQTNSGSAGAGSSNCNFINATPGPCLGGNYTLTVDVLGSGTLPSSGTLNISINAGAPQVINLPTTFPVLINGLVGNGSTNTISATFSAGAPTFSPISYTAPNCSSLNASISALTNVNCFGQATGSATVTVNSGTPQYTYSWNTSPVQTTATATGLAAGTYTVTITDASFQTTTLTVTISQPASPLQIYTHGTDPSCAALCDGTATVDVVGGSGPYSYLWSTSATSQTISSLCAGTYTVTVTDANGCVSSSSSTPLGCFQIQGILVNSCAPSEWNEEMVFFQVGASPLNTSALTVTWPTAGNIWRNQCLNPAYIAAANATITGGGSLIAVSIGGTIPANANVVLITENNLNAPIADFSNLAGPLYVIFQCSGNTQGHFSNTSATATPLTISSGVGCSESVSYSANSNLEIYGGYVLYSSSDSPTYLNNGCSIPYTIQTNSVTLSNSATPAPIVTNISYCVGASASPLTATGTNLLWYTAALGGTGSATAPTPSTASAGTTTYFVSQTVGSCESPRAAITVTVGSAQTATISYAGTPFCKSLSALQPVILSGASGGTFSSTAGLTINSSTGAITPSSSTAGAYTVTYTIAANGGCPAVTATTPVQIVAQPTVTSNPTSGNICSNSNPNIALTSTTLGSAFNWTYSGGASGSGTGTPINNVLTNTTCSNIIVNYSITATINGCTGPAISVPVTVKPKPTSTFTLSSDTICLNENVVFNYTGISCPGNTFTNTFTSATIVSGSSFGPYTLSWSAPGSYPIIFQVNNPTAGCTAPTYRDTVVVKALPVASFSGTTAICSNQPTALTLSSSIVGTTYAWTVVQSGVTGAVNGSGSSIAQTLTTTSATAGTAVYTVTPTANGCAGTPITITVTVNPLPNAGTVGAITVCSNSTNVNLFNSLLNFPTSGGTWSGPSSLTGASLGTFVPGTNTAGTYTYTLTTAGCTSTANVDVTVNPAAIVNAGSAQSVCSGGSVTLAGSVTGGTSTGIWSAPSGTFSNVNSLTSTYTPSITSGTVTLTLTSADPDGVGPCTVVPSTVVITVSSSPNVTSSGSTSICSNQTTALTLTSAVLGTSFSWKVVQSGVTGASNASGSSIAQTLLTTGATAGTAVYTVTPTANGCSGTPTTITVTVNPIPVASFLGTTPICSPASPAISLSSNLSGTTYAWTVVQTGVTGASNGSGISINQTLTASTTANGTAVYTVTPTANSCPGATLPISITVKPKPVASTLGSSYNICSGPTLATANSPSIQVLSNLGVGTTFAWTGSDGTSGSSNPISYAIPNNTCADQLITYSVTPSFNGCAGSAITIPLTVHPRPIAALSASASTICQNSAITVTFSGSACPTSIYNWTWPVGAIVSGSGAGPYTLTFPNSGNFSIDLSLSNQGGFCSAQTFSLPISVTEKATATAGTDITVCSGSTINLAGIIGGSATSATWSAPTGTFSNVNSLTSTYTPSITSGVVQLTLLTNDPDGAGPCTPAVSTFNVTVNLAAGISAGSATPICSGNTIQLNGFVSGSASLGTWSAASGTFNNVNLNNAIYTPPANASGNYVLTYTSNDPAGVCPAVSSTVTITVNPAATVAIGSFNQNICSGTTINLPGSFGGGATSAIWSAPSGTFGNANLAATTYTPSITSGTVNITLTTNDPDGAGPCAAASISRTITVTQQPTATLSYPGSPYCQNETANPLPFIVGTAGGTFSASPSSGLDLVSFGQISPSSSSQGTYTVTYSIGAVGGCPAFACSTQVVIYNQPPTPAISPTSICAGTPQTIVASNGTWFGFSVDGVEVQAPSANNTYTTPALALNSQVCVTSYPPAQFVFDGLLSEPAWGPAWAYSLGGPAPTVSFVSNNIDALFLKDRSGYLYGGIAGRVQNNSNNRVLLFLDTKTGGFNSLASWTNRTNAPYNSIEKLNNGITFDTGFEPDYILAMNLAAGVAKFDLYDMQNNANVLLGDDVSSNFLGYTANAGTGNYDKGFEFAIPMSAISNPMGSIKAFVMLVNDPGASATTTLSNQFLTRANSGDSNYGNGAVNFGSSAPNPITYSISPECSTQSCIVASASATTVTGFSYVSPLCQNGINPSPTFVSGYTPGGTFSANSVNLVINPSTGLINLAASQPGNYTITYSVAASSCSPAGSSTFNFTINASSTPVTGFTYTTPVCKNGVNPVVIPGSGFTSGGTYSYISIPSGLSTGLSFNTGSGAINLAGSTPGTYTVTYSVGVNGCQAAGSSTFTLTINPIPTTTSIFHD